MKALQYDDPFTCQVYTHMDKTLKDSLKKIAKKKGIPLYVVIDIALRGMVERNKELLK